MKPIIFNTEMVRAILSRNQTETRRPVIPQPVDVPDGAYMDPYNKNYNSFTVWTSDNKMCLHCGGDRKGMAHWKAPYQPGDTLYVRETFCPVDDTEYGGEKWIDYRATPSESEKHPAGWHNEPDDPQALKWRPSIHMPKEYARIFLTVESVHAEKINQMTDADAIAEGMQWYGRRSKYKFAQLWDGVYNKRGYGWFRNPWVWVIKFKIEEIK